MHERLYPLPMAFPSTLGPIQVVIDRDRWIFTAEGYALFQRLPAADRLALRGAMQAQVDLAKNTPEGERR